MTSKRFVTKNGLDTNAQGIDSTGGPLYLAAGGNAGIWLDSTGKVGIGIADPLHKLDVAWDDNSTQRIRLRNANAGASAVTMLHIANDVNNAFQFQLSSSGAAEPNLGTIQMNAGPMNFNAGGANHIRFTTGSQERLRIDANGRVILGSTVSRSIGGAPRSLQIDMNSQASISLTRTTADATGSTLVFGKTRAGNVTGFTTTAVNDELGAVQFAGSDGATADTVGVGIQAYVDAAVSTGVVPGRLDFITRNSSGTLATRLRIASGGDVSVRGGNLTMTGTIPMLTAADASGSLRFGVNGGVEALRIDSAGNVGVGNISPATLGKFVVNVNTNQNLYVKNNSSVTEIGSANGGLTAYNDLAITGYTVRFKAKTAGDEVARFNEAGLLGIGTTAPQRGLHLAGDTSTPIPCVRLERNNVRIWSMEVSNGGLLNWGDNTAGLTRFCCDSNGYFGVNTTTPSARLHVEDAIGGGAAYFNSSSTPTGNQRLWLIGFGGGADVAKARIEAYAASAWTAGTSTPTYLSFNTTPAGVTNHVERMRIDQDGNVGIGGTASARVHAFLTTAGNETPIIRANNSSSSCALTPTGIRVDGGVPLRFWQGGGEIAQFDTNLNMILGTTNRVNAAKLNVEGSMAISSDAGAQYLLMGNQNSGGANAPSMMRASNAVLAIGTGSSWALGYGGTMTVHANFSASGVLIGNSSNVASARLHVEGAVQTTNDSRYLVKVFDTTTMAAGVGGGIVFTGYSTTTTVEQSFGFIQGTKENATAADTAGQLVLGTRVAGGNLTSKLIITSGGIVRPVGNGTQNLGDASFRWGTVYAATGTINTSDRNEKTEIESLTEAELRVARAIKGLIRTYKLKQAVAEKGDEARIHVGVIAQDVRDAFEDEGLDANHYGIFCSDTWWEGEIEVPGGEEGDEVTTQRHVSKEEFEGAVQVTKLGVRYEELLAFVIAAL